MSFTVVDLGNEFFLKGALGKQTNGNLHWHLYSNNHTPAVSDTLGSYTEVTGSGYSVQSTAPSGWTVSTTSDVTTAVAGDVTFTFSGAIATIWGYFVTDSTDATLLAAEKFTSSQSIGSGGGTLKLTAPTITQNNC
jgi:hypothetical protein